MTAMEARRAVVGAEDAYGIYLEYMLFNDPQIDGWLRSARLSLDCGNPERAAARAEQVKQEVHRLSVANGLVRT